MKKIKIKFSGFWGKFDEENNFIINILKKHYEVIISETPDYLFYSVFSEDFLKYDCIRIFYTGENLCPDFNLCDYGIGFSYINFEDRYIRFPQYLVNDYAYYLNDNYANDLFLARNKHLITDDEINKKYGFCSFVYSNSDADPIREKFFDMLSKYKKVDSGGRFRNNIGAPIDDKLKFQMNYKFSIAFENSSTSGYTTEKILQAFAAKTIPIYWGNTNIDLEFNEKSFINCHKFNSLEEIVDIVIKLDSDNEIYKRMILEPAFSNNYSVDDMYRSLEVFLINIISQDFKSAFRRNRCYWGKRYEKKIKVGNKFYFALKKFLPMYSVIKKIKK